MSLRRILLAARSTGFVDHSQRMAGPFETGKTFERGLVEGGFGGSDMTDTQALDAHMKVARLNS